MHSNPILPLNQSRHMSPRTLSNAALKTLFLMRTHIQALESWHSLHLSKEQTMVHMHVHRRPILLSPLRWESQIQNLMQIYSYLESRTDRLESRIRGCFRRDIALVQHEKAVAIFTQLIELHKTQLRVVDEFIDLVGAITHQYDHLPHCRGSQYSSAETETYRTAELQAVLLVYQKTTKEYVRQILSLLRQMRPEIAAATEHVFQDGPVLWWAEDVDAYLREETVSFIEGRRLEELAMPRWREY
ncbi:hypothetical protein B0J11DRAFT_511821 [Dendryphion nanum]|uniref:Uncharacterized protein n=1 Tax=Dendryphion nanum TaxID=256645 RepID=A0A9P9IA74_9PLEO|nr:hypothetical protein B0J11DRAFT_511821 [Dendryphion nanum]